MTTFYVDTLKHNPCRNLALEEYLAENCREGEVWLYLWQNRNTVVIGRNQNPWRECKVKQIEDDGVTLVRRTTGGGAVYHDLGNLCFTFIADNALYDLTRQCGVIKRALENYGLSIEFSGRNDLLLDGRKFSGNAFSHKKNVSLQHGTLLIDSDMSKLALYLNPSAEKLKAKGVASVRSRVINLKQACPDITVEGLKQHLLAAFEELYAPVSAKITDADLDESEFAQKTEMYSSWEWNYGQTPEFDIMLCTRLSLGEIQLAIKANNSTVSGIKVYSDALDTDLPSKLENALLGCRFTPQAMAQAVDNEEISAWLAGLEI